NNRAFGDDVRQRDGALRYTIDSDIAGAPQHGQNAFELRGMSVRLPEFKAVRAADPDRPDTVCLQPSKRDLRVLLSGLATAVNGGAAILLNGVVCLAPGPSRQLFDVGKCVRPLSDGAGQHHAHTRKVLGAPYGGAVFDGLFLVRAPQDVLGEVAIID